MLTPVPSKAIYSGLLIDLDLSQGILIYFNFLCLDFLSFHFPFKLIKFLSFSFFHTLSYLSWDFWFSFCKLLYRFHIYWVGYVTLFNFLLTYCNPFLFPGTYSQWFLLLFSTLYTILLNLLAHFRLLSWYRSSYFDQYFFFWRFLMLLWNFLKVA